MAKKTVPALSGANATAAEGSSAPLAKPSKGGAIIGCVLVVLIAIGAGAGANIMLVPSASHEASTGAVVAEVAKPQRAAQRLPDLVGNLADGKTWIRLESTAVFEDTPVPEREVLAATAASAMLGFLKTLHIHDVEGPTGFLSLREDLSQVASSATGGKITTLLISAMVVE